MFDFPYFFLALGTARLMLIDFSRLSRRQTALTMPRVPPIGVLEARHVTCALDSGCPPGVECALEKPGGVSCEVHPGSQGAMGSFVPAPGLGSHTFSLCPVRRST